MAEPIVMTTDELWPRQAHYRYRLYAVIDDVPTVLAAAPSYGGIGVAIGCLHEDMKNAGQRLADCGRIGVMDTMPGGNPSPEGEWVVLPWDRS